AAGARRQRPGAFGARDPRRERSPGARPPEEGSGGGGAQERTREGRSGGEGGFGSRGREVQARAEGRSASRGETEETRRGRQEARVEGEEGGGQVRFARPEGLSPVDSRQSTVDGSGGRFLAASAAILLTWIVAVLAWSYVARDLPLFSERHLWSPETERRAPPLARYDSGWYAGIAEAGYGPAPARGEQSAHAFFPLYPIAV